MSSAGWNHLRPLKAGLMSGSEPAGEVQARIEAVLNLVAPREPGYWGGCVRAVEVHAGWVGSNWTVQAIAPPDDTRLIGLAANFVRAARPWVDAR